MTLHLFMWWIGLNPDTAFSPSFSFLIRQQRRQPVDCVVLLYLLHDQPLLEDMNNLHQARIFNWVNRHKKQNPNNCRSLHALIDRPSQAFCLLGLSVQRD